MQNKVPAVRTVGLRNPSSGEQDPGDETEQLPSVDPVEFAARLMITAALEADSNLAAFGKTAGAVILLVCPAGWEAALDLSWRWCVLGHHPLDGYEDDDTWSTRSRHNRLRNERPFKLSTEDSDGKPMRITTELRVALRDCRGLVITSNDRGLVPAELLAAADQVIRLSPMSPALLQVVCEAFGDETADIVDDVTAGCVLPDHLLAARRPSQTAAEYLVRIVRVIDASRPRPLPPSPGLDGLHGMSEAVAWGRSLAADLRAYRAGELQWSDVDRGCLLSGPPGVGKTTYARRLASECGVPLIYGSFSVWDTAGKQGYLSELQKAMRASFDEAKRQAPCILFIDELDSIPSRGATRHDDYWTPVVTCLLECLDGVGGREGVVVVAASNHADRIDPAILRSGRIDRHIRISLPDTDALHAILIGYVGSSVRAGDLRRVAVHGAGSSGADVERWARGARRRARADSRAVTAEDLLAEVHGLQRPRSAARIRQVAYHEAGHAVLVALRKPGLLQSVSIVQSGQAGGGASWQVEPGDDTNQDLGVVMRELLAGRAAEELVLGVPGGGSGGPPASDLARATLLGASAELAWGLGERLTWRADPQAETLPGLLAAHRDVAARVEERLRNALQDAKELLGAHRRELDAMAAALVERQALSGAEAEAVIAAARPRPLRDQELRCYQVGPSL